MRCAVGTVQSLRAARCLSQCLPQRPHRAAFVSPVRCSSSSDSAAGGSEDGSQSSDAVYKGFARQQPEQQRQQQQQQPKASAADALQNTLAGLSANVGRVSQGNNVILDTTNDEDKWRELDMQVNEYPGQRTFKAIGTGDQDFVASMTACVEAVVGKVHTECINQRLSAKGNYISVTVGPVWVETPEQVLEIYERMKSDGRLRFFF